MRFEFSLNHVNLLTHNLENLSAFYQKILGCTVGFRPPFPNAGIWLYQGETAIIHLSQATKKQANQEPGIQHFALSGAGLGAFLTHLRACDVPYRVSITPQIELRQVEIFDPDGNMFEVLFQQSDSEGVDLSPYEWEDR